VGEVVVVVGVGVVVVVVGAGGGVVVLFGQPLPPLGRTHSFSQPEKLLMEHSSAAALRRRRMEEKRINWIGEKVKND
jgi:hypothetical protein